MRGFHISQIKNILPCPIRLPRCIAGGRYGLYFWMSDREDYREVFKKSPLPKAVLKALGSTGVFSEHLKMKKKI